MVLVEFQHLTTPHVRKCCPLLCKASNSLNAYSNLISKPKIEPNSPNAYLCRFQKQTEIEQRQFFQMETETSAFTNRIRQLNCSTAGQEEGYLPCQATI